MKCQKCGKNEASICMVKMVGDKKESIYICKDCAETMEHNLFEEFSNLLSPMLGGLFDGGLNIADQMICPNCGQTKGGFDESYKMGCEDCYDTFKLPVTDRHVGKIPEKEESLYSFNLINEKELELKKLVSEEKYEDAAKLRDEIKVLKEEAGNEK